MKKQSRVQEGDWLVDKRDDLEWGTQGTWSGKNQTHVSPNQLNLVDCILPDAGHTLSDKTSHGWIQTTEFPAECGDHEVTRILRHVHFLLRIDRRGCTPPFPSRFCPTTSSRTAARWMFFGAILERKSKYHPRRWESQSTCQMLDKG